MLLGEHIFLENYDRSVTFIGKNFSRLPILSLLISRMASTPFTYQTVQTQKDGKIYKITINRPERKNALVPEMYEGIIKALTDSAKSDSVLTVITGTGDYYSSGNDFGAIAQMDFNDKDLYVKANNRVLRFVAAFIDHPKPLIALVNGPTIGIAATTLALCDVVYAADTATFHTPFTSLGLVAEGCSSYTFPRLMGAQKANEVLLFCRKLSARESYDCNLYTEVFPAHSFQKEAWTRVKRAAELPPQSLKACKSLVRDMCKEDLHKVNKDECAMLLQRTQSDEFRDAIMSFFGKKSKM